jgi:hypothetical protein
MQFPSRDLTLQYISTSYQDVVQRYAATGSLTYLLDGLGYVICGILTSSVGQTVLTQDQTASYSLFAVSSSYTSTSSVINVTSSLISVTSASWASASLSSSYAISSSYANISSLSLVSNVALLAGTASLADVADSAIDVLTTGNNTGLYYPTFVQFNTTTQPLYTDIDNGITWDMDTETLTATNIIGNLSGTASNAISASYAANSSGGSGTTLITASTYQITSSFAISASWSPGGGSSVSASWASSSISASYALTASYAANSSAAGTTLVTASTYQITSSWANNLSGTASWATNVVNIGSASWASASISSSFAGSSITSSYVLTSSFSNISITTTSSSFASQSISASWAPAPVSASWASSSVSSSYSLNSSTASYITSSNIIGNVTSISASWASSSLTTISSSYASASTSTISASWATISYTASYITASKIDGVVTNAVNASNIQTTGNNTGLYYPTFVQFNSSMQPLYTDIDNGITWDMDTETLTATNIVGNLNGTASDAASASYLNPGATFYVVSGSNGVPPAFIESYDYNPISQNYLPPYKAGRMWYDNRYLDWAYYPNTGSNATSFRLHLGKEVTIGVHNPYSVTLPRLSAVYIGTSSYSGQYQPDVYLAIADGTGLHSNVEGIIRNDIPSGSNGFMLMNGVMHRTNMGSLTLGQSIWLSTSSFGGYQTTEPIQPYEQVLLGYCSETGSLGSFICSINNLPPPINTYAGLVSNITITNNNDGTITISTGSVNLYNNLAGSGLVYTYSLPQTTITLITGSTNYIVAIQSGKVGQYTNISNRLLIDSVTVIPISAIYPNYKGPGNWELHQFDFNPYALALADRMTLKDTMINNFQRQDGLTLFITGSGTDFGVTAGDVWFGIVFKSLPQYQSSLTASSDTYHYVNSASNWTYTTQSGYDNGNYNGPGGFVPLTTNSWSVNFVYKIVSDNTNDVAIILSSQQYDNLIDAEIAQPSSTLPQFISDFGILLGRFIVQSGSTSPTIQSAFLNIFTTTPITQHNQLLGLQGGTSGQYYHLTSDEYTGTGTGIFVRATGSTITTTGSLFGTSSNATSASYSPWANYSLSASWASSSLVTISASWASASISSSYSITSSWSGVSLITTSASFASSSISASYITASNIVGTIINALTASYITASNIIGNITSVSASWASASISSSYSKNTDTASAIYNTSSFVSASYAVLFTSASGVQSVYFDDQNAFTYNPGTDVLAVPSISASTYIYTVDPTVSNQVATKNYVDQINPQSLDYYFRSASADIAGYEYMLRLTSPLSASNQTIVQTAVSASQVFITFVSPAFNIPNISQGQYNVHFHLYRVGGNVANAIHPELYIRSGSTEYIFLGAGAV